MITTEKKSDLKFVATCLGIPLYTITKISLGMRVNKECVCVCVCVCKLPSTATVRYVPSTSYQALFTENSV
jgi:hypothetical protein